MKKITPILATLVALIMVGLVVLGATNMTDSTSTTEATSGNSNFTDIPYYSWSNRGVGRMQVWIPETNE